MVLSLPECQHVDRHNPAMPMNNLRLSVGYPVWAHPSGCNRLSTTAILIQSTITYREEENGIQSR